MVSKIKVLISGSSNGIGFEIAKKFLENSASVWITGRNQHKLFQVLKILKKSYPDQNIEFSAVDLTNLNEIEELSNDVEKKWGRLNGLVLNLGSGTPRFRGESRKEAKKRLFEINFRSPVNTLIAFENLLEQFNSSVTFVSTIAVKTKVGAPHHYVKAKKKLEIYAMNRIIDLSKKGIRCNIVRPGHTFTLDGVWDIKIRDDRENTERFIKSTVPLGRLAEASEIASAVYFLSSSEAKFITGATLDVAGGLGVKP